MSRRAFRRLIDRIRRLGRTPPTAITSPRQMALENAAEALGEELGNYYVDEWEVLEDELSETERRIPPEVRERIDARREETVVYVQRQRERRRRRRVRTALAGTGVAALLALGIAQLLASPSDKASDADRPAAPTATIPPSWRVPGQINTPAPMGNSVSVSASRAGTRFVTTSFIGYYGWICSPLTYVRSGIGDRRTNSWCIEPRRLSRNLERFHAVIVGMVGQPEGYVLRGYAAREVESVGGPGWKGGYDAEISRLWAPWAAGIDNPPPPMRPFKTFIALARVELGKREMESEGSTREPYEVFDLPARLSDGRIVRVRRMASDL